MAPFSLVGRVALVTGGSRGLGLAIARVFELLIARDEARLEAAAAQIRAEVPGTSVICLAGDVASPSFAKQAVEGAVQQLGRVDVLVNNAGIGLSGPLEGVSEGQWDDVVDVDLKGPYLFCREAVPHMKGQHWGRIVNVASISGQTGGVRASVAYSAAKAGLIGMTKTLARDLGVFGITANAISPGQIQTDMGGRLNPEERRALEARIPLGRVGDPADIAYAALFLASEEAGYVTGHTLDVNGGILFR
jgi:3-oxoacyl-[acyl-carrier protein] reductase